MYHEKVLDHGYVSLVEYWGSDERVIESARMSTQKGFRGWGPKCSKCGLRMIALDDDTYGAADYAHGEQKSCEHDALASGDEKLLKYLWEHNHATPFEMAGLTVEIKAPIFVFREWHRHRTQSFNEMSARYIPIPNENYIPTFERLELSSSANKQAQGTTALKPESAELWLSNLENLYNLLEATYQSGLQAGIPKEVARVILPVGRYSIMRASANLRNWLAFLKLRCDPSAQWEIRQYANLIAVLIQQKFPRTYEVSYASIGL